MENPRVRLGELLVRAGLITGRQLDEALAEQRRVGKRLGSLLVETGLVSETQVTQILSQQLSVPWVSLHHIDFSRELLDLVPVDAVERFCLIPIYVRRVRGLGDALYVAMDDPTNHQALTEVAERSGLHVRAMIAPPSDIRAAIHAYYGIGEAPAPPPVPARRAPEDVEADVPTGVQSRAEVEARAAAARAAEPVKGEAMKVESMEPARAAQATPERTTGSVAQAPAVKAAGAAAEAPAAILPEAAVKNGVVEDLRAMAPAKRPAVAAESVAATSEAASPALAAASGGGGEGSVRGQSKEGAERLRRAMTDSARGGGGKPGRKMVALTLLDGTEIRLPSKGKGADVEGAGAPPAAATPTTAADEKLTARDLVAALRAAAHGADASEVLGDNVRWERLFASLLSVLLKKNLISDREFVEELIKG